MHDVGPPPRPLPITEEDTPSTTPASYRVPPRARHLPTAFVRSGRQEDWVPKRGSYHSTTATSVRESQGQTTHRAYQRSCMFICACGCGTHVYSTCTGPGHGLRTPYWTGCTARVNTGACLLHFACVRAVRCSAWIVRAAMYVECVCVCVR